MLDNQSPEASAANTSKVNENQFYFAIRSSNLKLIKTLVAQCKAPNKLDESLSQAYDELRLKNVPISDEIRIFVESTLIDLRFFSSTSTKQFQSNKDSMRKRIQLVLENINLLKTEYSNTKAVDEKFLFIAKFVAQNIHILKRQLKSTYDRLPWEEVEFCLVSFISSYMKRQEINLFYQASLNKFKILNYLETFGTSLAEEIKGVDVDKFSDLPKLKREEVTSEIISSSPEFEELYSDYQQIRDIHSLKKISDYIDLALSADPKQKEGQLVIIRTLQVIGECLKNTLESPKLSSITSELLLLSLQQNTRKILIDLRNSLSHAYSLSKRMEIEENADINFFIGIQNNTKKIGDVVTDILFNSKMKTVRMLLTKIINSKNLDEIKEVVAVLDNVELEIDSLVSFKMTEDEKLENLVKELSDIIIDKTSDEQELFDKINNIISSIKAKSENIKTDYIMGFASLRGLSSKLNDNKADNNVIRGIKFHANKTLENISPKMEPKSLKEIAELSTKVSHSVRSRMTGKDLDEVNRLIYEIFCIAEFGVDDNKSIRKLREELKGNTTFEYKKSKDYGISEKKYNKQIEFKLLQLKKVLNDNQLIDNFTKKFSSYKSDKKLQAVIEMLVLDIMSILERENRLGNNLLFLDDNAPLLTGKCLRDHLAHDNLLVSTLLPDSSIAVFLNARKLTVEDMLQNKKKIGKLLKDDPYKVKEKHNQDFIIIDNQRKMFIALEEGDLETFKHCLEKGADIGARDINLWTTLHFAVKSSNLETIKYILDHSVNASAKDINGQSPLHIAAAYGRKDVIEFFIQEVGLYVDELNNHGKTPLHIAAQNGHKDAVEVLLENNSSTVIQDMTGCEPLHYAIRNNYVDVTKVLLKNVDINEIRNGCTPLHIAAEFGYLELVDFLLQNGADVNSRKDKGVTPLHLSSLNGHFEVVNTLIERGANVNARVIDGCTPLHYAVENGHQKVIYILLKHNANVNVADRVYNNTPLHYASKDGYKQIVEILLDNGANTNVSTVEGVTPLHFAAQGGHLEIISILLKHNVDVNVQDKNGATPLHYAAGCGREKAAELLVKHKANVNAQNNKDTTPLHVAASIGQNNIIKVLIKNNARVDAQDVEGNTPLHEAAVNGNIDTLELLVKNKAQVNYRNNHGITPIQLATFSGKKNAIDFLMRNKTQVSSKETEDLLYIAVEKNDKELVKNLIASGANVNAKNDSLISAIKHNYKEIVEILIAHGANVNMKGGGPLSLAVFAGYTDIVKILIKNKARVHVKHDDNATLLHLAATRGHKEIVDILIKKELNVDAVTTNNVTPLYLAAQEGHEEIVKILLRNGANVNFNSKEGAPIHMAAGMGHNNVVKILINEGAKINIKDRKNRIALELAVANGHLQVVQTFFQYKEREIDVNDKGNDEFTPLHIASQQSNTEIVKYLVEKGCDINAKNASGSKPIHIAAREGYLDTVKFFLSNGLNINEPGMKDQTLLHYAAMNGQLEVMKYLIAQGADVNAKDANGVTPLHIAANLGHKDVIEVLLKNGAIYNVVDKFNRKPLLLAANNKDVINLLASTEKLYEAVKRNSPSEVENYIKAGACVNAKNVEGVTPLYYSAWKGYGNIVDILLQNQASPNIVDKKGLTPLHYAAKFSHLKVVESLLFHGAIYNAASDSGKTPLDFTTDKNITALLNLIDKSFRNVENGNNRVIDDLSKVIEMSTIKAIMNARNRENKTLIVAAIHNNFSKVEQLKQVFQSGVSIKVNVALMLLKQGNYKEALDIFQKVFESRRQVLGEDNPGTLEIQRYIAQTLYKQGKYQEALNILNDIVEKQTEMLGMNNKDTLNTRSMIALVLHRQERNDEALGIYQEVYSKQREVLGSNHLDTLDTQFHMALVLERQGQYKEALKINKMVFEHRKRILGEYDPATIYAQNNIAFVLLSQKKYEESLEIYNDVLKKKKDILGDEHPDTLRTLQSIAGILLRQKKYNESLSAHKEVLDIQKRTLGPSHPETLNTQFNMGDVLFTQGKFIRAFRVYKESLELGKAILGIGDPRVLQASQKMELIKLRFKFTSSESEELKLIQSIQEELNLAASNGDIQAISNLLDSGADVNDKDTEGRTPLCYAVNNGHRDTIDILLKNGADPTLVTNKGNTPLHIASNKGNTKAVKILLAHVKNKYSDKLVQFINTQTTAGETSALHIASNIEVTRSLLQYGAVYNIKNKEGKTPLDLAKNYDIRKLLSFTNELFEDAKNGNHDIISKLDNLDVDDFVAVTNARNDQGHTLLQVAIANKHRDIATELSKMLKNLERAPSSSMESVNVAGPSRSYGNLPS